MNFNAPAPFRSDDDVPPINTCRVLVIDDSKLTCKLIKTRLEIEGIENIEIAYDGREGLDKLDTFLPDLVILDIQMPILDGLEVLGLIRSKPKYDSLPVIIESALDGDIDPDELIEMGATNIITKPLDHNLLAARVRLHLEHLLLVKSLRDYRARLSQELDLARNMQMELLPSARELEGLSAKHRIGIENIYLPCSEMGGDFWSIRSLDENRAALLMIDFAGHGIGASINTFRLNMILSNMSPQETSPSEFLQILNTELCRYLRPAEFATAFFGIVYTNENRFDYAAAGSPPPITADHVTRKISIGDSRGVPLGVSPGVAYENRCMEFGAETTLYLFSDALPEAIDTNGDAVGIDGIRTLIESDLGMSETGRVLDLFMDRFNRRVDTPPNDDLTLICLSKPSLD